jgi:hypothetical protein
MAYLINLDSRPDRLAAFYRQRGVEGVVRCAAQAHATGARGCMASHRSVLQLARDTGLEHVLIFEDDAVLKANGIQELESMVQSLPADWEVLLFSISYGSHIMYTHLGRFWGGVHLMRVNHNFNGTYAMAVSRRAYDKCIAKADEELRRPDGYETNVDIDVYNTACEGNIYLTVPFQATVLAGDQSDIRAYDTSDDREKVEWCEVVLRTDNNI